MKGKTMNPDYTLLYHIGYNDDTNLCTLHNAYFMHIAQYADSPYYMNFFFGDNRISLEVFNTLDELCDYLRNLQTYTTVNIIWYTDFCAISDK